MIALTIAMTMFNPIAGAVTSSSGVQSVTNETVVAEHGNWSELEGYDVEDGSVTVYEPNGSDSYETATEGTDYEVDYSAGAIEALSSGSIGDGDELKVTYDYAATDSTTTTILGLIPMFLGLLVLGVMAAKIQDGL